MEKNHMFQIITDIEQKAYIAAVTDGKATQIAVSGAGGECCILLVKLVSSLLESVFEVELDGEDGSEAKKEALDKTMKAAKQIFDNATHRFLVGQMRKELKNSGALGELLSMLEDDSEEDED